MCQTDFTESQLTAYRIVGNFDDDSNWQIRPRNVYIGKLVIFLIWQFQIPCIAIRYHVVYVLY